MPLPTMGAVEVVGQEAERGGVDIEDQDIVAVSR